ncbi:Arm DNA-binding domain-containing protein [Oxalobacter sp. OxGP1]|uniref:Arm DNA-binding domain-containing protein n=1 Tax=Oxalobacter paeniformigenes TaxID=2946594 RepID=UPI0022AFF4A7|nr:Arm DNA-binding domain-containing protein [Oxalobacter paeniformigenes]MCZ4053739.1 Arm DNA-binding domain-containing protein [Oxalobacter paeniformigenes]
MKNLKNGVHAVGGAKGLYIKKAGRQAYFFLRYTDITKKRHDFKIGNYPQCSLKQARIDAHEQRKKINAVQNTVE